MFLLLSYFRLGKVGDIVIVVCESMIVPKVVLAEEQSQALKILALQTVLKRRPANAHDGADVFQHLEGLAPEAELGGHFELLHTDFDVACVNVSLFNINVDGFLLLSLISFVEGCLETSSQALTETLELLHTVITIHKVKDFVESGHIYIFQLLVHADCLHDGFVTFPNQSQLVSYLGLSLLELRMEAVEDYFRRGLIDLDVGQVTDDGQIIISDFLIENGL